MFANERKFVLSRFLASQLAIGDEIAFPVLADDNIGIEIFFKKSSPAPFPYLYQAPIEFVSKPKENKIKQHFVLAEVRSGSLGIASIFLPCGVLREYFYRVPRTTDGVDHSTLYEALRIPATASPAELRVIWNSNRWARGTQNEWRWSGHSTSSAIPSCVLAMTRC